MARAVGLSLWAHFGAELRAARIELEERCRELRSAPARAARSAHASSAGVLEERVERGGWCLCVVAAALGSDLLGARHEARGLEWLVEAVSTAGKLALGPEATELPDLPGEGAGREIALLAAWCVLEVGSRQGVVRWSPLGPAHRPSGLAFALEREAPELLERCARVRTPDARGPTLSLEARRLELRWS